MTDNDEIKHGEEDCLVLSNKIEQTIMKHALYQLDMEEITVIHGKIDEEINKTIPDTEIISFLLREQMHNAFVLYLDMSSSLYNQKYVEERLKQRNINIMREL